MRKLSITETIEITGGFLFSPGMVAAYVMGKNNLDSTSAIVASAAIEAGLFYVLSPYACLYFPGYVYHSSHLVASAVVGAGLGYMGYKQGMG